MCVANFGILTFLLSCILLCSLSKFIAYRLGTTSAESFWIFIAATALQLGTISVGISFFSLLTPYGWLAVQIFAFATVLFLARRFTHNFFQRNTGGAGFGSLWQYISSAGSFLLSLRKVSLAALLCIACFLILSLLQQNVNPISGYDERMYHASRVLYWVTHRSIFSYTTHNARQVVFPFGAELFFLWPVLFTKAEFIGRIIFWSAYPLAAVGLYLLLRALETNTHVAILGVLAFVATPIIATSSVGLKPEMWLTVFVLGTAFWMVQSYKSSHHNKKAVFFAALFFMLSVNVKVTALAMLPSILVLPFMADGKATKVMSGRSILLGMGVALLLSGAVVTFGGNVRHYGHPLGPENSGKCIVVTSMLSNFIHMRCVCHFYYWKFHTFLETKLELNSLVLETG